MGGKRVLRNYDNEGNLISKECYKCHEVKAISEFSKDKSRKDGLYNRCKDCTKQYGKEYRKENKDKKKEYNAEYYKQNADKIKEYYQRNDKNAVKRKERKAEYMKQYGKQWRKENKDKKKEQNAKYRKENKDKIAEYQSEYRKENADKIKEQQSEYRNQKVEQSLIEIKAYVEIDPQKYDYNPNEEIYGIVYLVHNIKSDKYYVGQTTVGFDNRYNMGWLYEHSRKDTVKTDLELYGEDSFEYVKIFKVAHCQRDLDKLEAYYIDYYNAYDNGYNETRGNIFTERTYKINNIRFDWVA